MGVGNQPLDGFLAGVAAAKPTPGGGTAAAVCGALAAALSEMVASLGLTKEAWSDAHPELPRVVARARELRTDLLRLADEDAEAFEAVMAAMKLPRGTEDEKSRRRREMQKALRGAAEVPLETAHRCRDVLRLSMEAAQSGSRSAITDAGVSALVAHAALQAAALNVRINLASLTDETFRSATEAALDALLGDGEKLARDVSDLVRSKI